MLKYLSYVSHQSHALSENTIEEMLQRWREKNTALGITGILVYIEGTFTQYIEGDEQEIDELFDKISKDKRHHNIIELFSGFTEERFYENWSMAYKRLNPQDAEDITGFIPFDHKEFLRPPGKSPQNHPAISLMTSFIKNIRVA